MFSQEQVKMAASLDGWNYAFQFSGIRTMFVDLWNFKETSLCALKELDLAPSTLICSKSETGFDSYKIATSNGKELYSFDCMETTCVKWIDISRETAIYKILSYCGSNRTRYEILTDYLQRLSHMYTWAEKLFSTLWISANPKASLISDDDLEILKILMRHPDFIKNEELSCDTDVKQELVSMRIGKSRLEEALHYPVLFLDNDNKASRYYKFRLLQYGMENMKTLSEIIALFSPYEQEMQSLIRLVKHDRDKLYSRHNEEITSGQGKNSPFCHLLRAFYSDQTDK